MDIHEAQKVLIDLEAKHGYKGPEASPKALRAFTPEDREQYFAAHDAFTDNGARWAHLDASSPAPKRKMRVGRSAHGVIHLLGGERTY